MADKGKQPIIIKKKKAAHAGAHGGAWKVAYADFVTAMMAFFMVMWLLGSDEETKAAVSNYFNNPTSVLRIDMSNKENIPMGDQTGAGQSVLKGADGEVPEALVKNPSKPILEGNTAAEDPSESAIRLASSGDQMTLEAVKISILQKDIFETSSYENFKPNAALILAKIGKIAKNAKSSKIQVYTTYYEGQGSYEFQVSRVVAIKKMLGELKVDPERVETIVLKQSSRDIASVPNEETAKFDFHFLQ